MAVVNLNEVAIVIRPEKDNVAVVKTDFLDRGAELQYNGGTISLSGRALRGQSFAIKDIPQGRPFVTLGDPIGLASRAVRAGDPLDETNIDNRLPRLRVRYRDNPAPNAIDPDLAARTFEGYVRNDGSFGIRNYVGIVTSGMCSSAEAREIAFRAMHEIYTRDKYPNVDGVVPIVHDSGCGMPDGRAVGILNQLLTNTLRHPNIGSAIYVDLGCGKTCVECSVPVFESKSRITTSG